MEPIMIRHSTLMKADRERVWKAITTPEAITKWFGMTFKFERLAVGESIEFGDDDHVITSNIVIAEVDAPHRFAFRWPAELGYPVLTLVTFVLEPTADGTVVTVTEEGFEALPEDVARRRYDMNAGGWRIQLEENLPAYLKATADA